MFRPVLFVYRVTHVTLENKIGLDLLFQSKSSYISYISYISVDLGCVNLLASFYGNLLQFGKHAEEMFKTTWIVKMNMVKNKQWIGIINGIL